MKMNELQLYGTTWIDLVNITLKERNKMQKNVYCKIPFI